MRKDELFEHMLSLMNNLDGFTILDKNGYYLYCNESWSRSMGYDFEDIKDKRAWDIFPDSQSKIALKTGRVITGHPVEWGMDKIPGFTSYYPFFDENGMVAGCYCVVTFAGLDNAHILQNRIAELSEHISFLEEEIKKNNNARYSIDNILGESPPILNLKESIEKAARLNSTVLVRGETGVGKELVAHAIHLLSRRRNYNFVRVNCAAIPPELVESEFFGYKGGAFTGANPKGKMGKFVFANNGTLFMDEVDSLPMTVQAKFLRVLQEREVEPVGDHNVIPVDVRIIASSNASLEKLVAEGKFRKDLYYRLNVLSLDVPPLRERKEDIPIIVDGLIQRINKQQGTYAQGISPAALKLLCDYEWPGNVRELQNSLETAISFADSPILQKKDFYALENIIRTKKHKQMLLSDSVNLEQAKANFERDMIIEALKANKNNRSKVALQLGISRTMLYKKLNQYGIREEDIPIEE